MKGEYLKISIAFIISIVLGLLAQLVSDPIEVFALFIVHILLAFFSLLILVIGALSKKFKIWYIIGLIPILAAYLFTTAVRIYKHNKVNEIVIQLTVYKNRNGKYPKSLSSLENNINLKGLNYTTRTNELEFELDYLINGISRETYESKTGTWNIY